MILWTETGRFIPLPTTKPPSKPANPCIRRGDHLRVRRSRKASGWDDQVRRCYGAGGDSVGVLGIARDISLCASSRNGTGRLHAQLLRRRRSRRWDNWPAARRTITTMRWSSASTTPNLALKPVESTGRCMTISSKALSAAETQFQRNITRQLLAFRPQADHRPGARSDSSTVEGMLKCCSI